nr:MAG TPA: hypothetical protein [Caudoviricetes sp.]
MEKSKPVIFQTCIQHIDFDYHYHYCPCIGF